MLESIRALCDKWGTRPRIREILLDGLQRWLAESLDPDVYCQLKSTIFAPEFQRLINQQHKIGWKEVGRFSWECSDMSDAYYVTRPDFNPKQRRNGSTWQVAVIGCLWGINGTCCGKQAVIKTFMERTPQRVPFWSAGIRCVHCEICMHCNSTMNLLYKNC